jgi:hypothetical protein
VPLVAVTTDPVPAVVAVNKPDELSMVPPPFVDQVNVGCGIIKLLNWSYALALNCCCVPERMLGADGDT